MFGGVRRHDAYSISVEAIREVVVNALVHASYAERGTPIRVGFYDNRIHVDSPGLLLPGMTIESMRRASRLRNPSLARIFREAGIMEQWGTGVQRVYDQIAAAGLPEPRVEEVMGRLRFTFYVPSHAPDAGLGADAKHQDTYDPRSNDRHVGRNDVVMVRAAPQGPAHRNDLLDAANLKHLSQNHSRQVVPLVSDRLLELTIPDKPRSRDQRYRISERGQALLSEHEDSE